MDITLEWLKEKQACEEAVIAFKKTYVEQEVDYQDLLNALAEAKRPDWASWLLDRAGPIDTILHIDGSKKIYGNLFFAGKIEVAKSIAVRLLATGCPGTRFRSRAVWDCAFNAGYGIEAGG